MFYALFLHVLQYFRCISQKVYSSVYSHKLTASFGLLSDALFSSGIKVVILFNIYYIMKEMLPEKTDKINF